MRSVTVLPCDLAGTPAALGAYQTHKPSSTREHEQLPPTPHSPRNPARAVCTLYPTPSGLHLHPAVPHCSPTWAGHVTPESHTPATPCREQSPALPDGGRLQPLRIARGASRARAPSSEPTSQGSLAGTLRGGSRSRHCFHCAHGEGGRPQQRTRAVLDTRPTLPAAPLTEGCPTGRPQFLGTCDPGLRRGGSHVGRPPHPGKGNLHPQQGGPGLSSRQPSPTTGQVKA